MSHSRYKPQIALVNSYEKDDYLLALFAEAGASLFHIQSEIELLPKYRNNFRPHRFIENIVFDGDIETCRNTLRKIGVDYVVAGGEYGVELAEALGSGARQPTNDPKTTHLRRNKFDMNEALAKAGLPAVRQVLCDSKDTLVRFFDAIGGTIVIKPLNSGLNDHVYFCSTLDEAEHAFEATMGQKTIYGDTIQSVILQEYLSGREYMVNTVSRNKHHHVAEIWEKAFISVNGVQDLCDTIFLLPSRGTIQDELVSYTHKCLDILGVTDSPAHVEIRYTDSGPRLIELGARRAGGHMSRISKLALEESQFDWIVKSYVDPESFFKTAGQPYNLCGAVASTSIISRANGIFKHYNPTDKVRSLPSFNELLITVSPGQELQLTTNDSTYLGYVVLYDEYAAVVERDARTIRLLDSQD